MHYFDVTSILCDKITIKLRKSGVCVYGIWQYQELDKKLFEGKIIAKSYFAITKLQNFDNLINRKFFSVTPNFHTYRHLKAWT